ncbi:AAA family ATPase [Mesorhizobium sp. M5C.F.Cr.IN.023.01.1.1]|uniref:ATP-dependent nuclease n=1 Tax=Mesorhizobium sp. M5C.F.Cr.IN.023.01.1.1 TaxID=2496768 RepID=UPI0013E2F8F3|nr:AAA family ATPase [Mesorhizobium sp. M5C.F.Cr.IN.023.01.1.1]
MAVPIDYKITKIIIKCWRGIDALELDLRPGFPNVLIGANNAGKTAVLDAIALVLNLPAFGGQWSPDVSDFYCDQKGNRSGEFLLQVLFDATAETGYPAVRGVGTPISVRGVQVKGTLKDGKTKHQRTLLDEKLQSILIAPRTALGADDKAKWKDHGVNWMQYYARLDEISEHAPEVWLFRPQEIEASLYVWKRGPIARLSRLLAQRFLTENWSIDREDGKKSPMPDTLYRAHEFFQKAVEMFPFWREDMKPKLEDAIARYVGSQAKVDLRPDVQLFEEWIAQQLAISLATDPAGVVTPLSSMGEGWQSIVRLAALEALSQYKSEMKERVIVLLEEPETHLHPHLRRKLRKVLAELAKAGWIVMYSTHSPEMISFNSDQIITRLVRSGGKLTVNTVHTDKIAAPAKLQSKLDERGAHDFLFSAGTVFVEGRDDGFACRYTFDGTGVDLDGRSISITQCNAVSVIPAFAAIAKDLGIRWCALTDEDKLPAGGINPKTESERKKIEALRTNNDIQVQWPGKLEACLGIAAPDKAVPETTEPLIAHADWRTNHPDYHSTAAAIAAWIDPALKI